MRTEPPVLAPIFRSDGQARLLSVVLLGDGEASISDLADLAGMPYATVHREVARLIDAGILRERPVGKSRLIAADEASPLVAPLREILRVATGPVPLLAAELRTIPGIHAAFLYGSFAARLTGVAGASPSDIDLMVIGTPAPELVYDDCERVESLVGRPINPTILNAAEYGRVDGFGEHVRTHPRIPVIGDLP